MQAGQYNLTRVGRARCVEIAAKPAFLALATVIGVATGLVVGVQSHAPNFFWMGVFTFDRLMATSYSDLLTNIVIPVFRPTLPLEKWIGGEWGVAGVRTFSAVVYSAFAIGYFIVVAKCVQLAAMKSCKAGLTAIAMSCGLAIYCYEQAWGSFADIGYAAASTVILAFWFADPAALRSRSTAMLIVAALSALVADNSRPYFLLVAPLWLVACLIRRRHLLAIALLAGIALAIPYHAAQLYRTGSPVLSNYSGCNLVEVFRVEATPFPYPYPHASINSEMGTGYCRRLASKVAAYLVEQPTLALGDVLAPMRLLRVLTPTAFTPYRGVPDVSDAAGREAWSLWAALFALLYIPGVAIVGAVVIGAVRLGRVDVLLASMATLAPAAFSVLAHSGQEGGRVGMAFILPGAALALVALGGTGELLGAKTGERGQ